MQYLWQTLKTSFESKVFFFSPFTVAVGSKGHGIISYSGSVKKGYGGERTLVALTLAQTRPLTRIPHIDVRIQRPRTEATLNAASSLISIFFELRERRNIDKYIVNQLPVGLLPVGILPVRLFPIVILSVDTRAYYYSVKCPTGKSLAGKKVTGR